MCVNGISRVTAVLIQRSISTGYINKMMYKISRKCILVLNLNWLQTGNYYTKNVIVLRSFLHINLKKAFKFSLIDILRLPLSCKTQTRGPKRLFEIINVDRHSWNESSECKILQSESVVQPCYLSIAKLYVSHPKYSSINYHGFRDKIMYYESFIDKLSSILNL